MFIAQRVVLDKISLAQFRSIHQEITGDHNKTPTDEQAECYEQIRRIVKNTDALLSRDLCVNNEKKTSLTISWTFQETTSKN